MGYRFNNENSKITSYIMKNNRNFNDKIADGLRQAPIERAKAIRVFWQYLTKIF